jgi:hypothetical protein
MHIGAARVAPESLVPHQIAAPTTNADTPRGGRMQKKTIAAVDLERSLERQETLKRLAEWGKSRGIPIDDWREIAVQIAMYPQSFKLRSRVDAKWSLSGEIELYVTVRMEQEETGESVPAICRRLAPLTRWRKMRWYARRNSQNREPWEALRERFYKVRNMLALEDAAVLRKEADARGQAAAGGAKAIIYKEGAINRVLWKPLREHYHGPRKDDVVDIFERDGKIFVVNRPLERKTVGRGPRGIRKAKRFHEDPA